MLRAFAAACAAPPLLAVAVAASTGAPAAQAPPAPAPVPVERVTLPPVPLREAPSLLATSPAGWTSVQPGPALAAWTRAPLARDRHPRPAAVVGRSGHWPPRLRQARAATSGCGTTATSGTRPSTSSGGSLPSQGADQYNSGVLRAHRLLDISVWHQAQVGLSRRLTCSASTDVDGVAKRVTQEPAAARVRPAGEWNTYELVARGRTLTLWVNGAVTSEIAVDVPRGHFGLEAEGWRIEFRNMRIKALD